MVEEIQGDRSAWDYRSQHVALATQAELKRHRWIQEAQR